MNSSLFSTGAGLIILVIYAVVNLIVFLIGIWIAYAVIWRAVRRGLKEFHRDNPTTPVA